MMNSIEIMSKHTNLFKKFYPEKNIKIIKIEIVDDNTSIMTVQFPDGTFYFVCRGNTVSPSYDSIEEVKLGLGIL